MKFGRKPARRDPRNLQLRALRQLKALPPLPPSYHFDTDHPSPPIPTPAFGNDRWGDCVLAARAHATLRFERVEQDALIPIADAEVLAQWRIENGGTDEGLFMLDSLKLWRSKGWTAAGRPYRCAAFAEIDPCNTGDVQAGIALFGSIQGGFDLPLAVTQNCYATAPWDLVLGPLGATDPEGGHAMAVVGYDELGLDLITWGRRQRCTWAWFECYCSELYAVVDALDPWRAIPGIDVPLLEDYLRQVTA